MKNNYQVADMMIGVRNMIEAADLRRGDQVLLLADTRSDKTTVEALTAGLRFFGAEPMTLVTEPISRYGAVPQAVLEAMHASDVVVWVWPVFITFTPAHRAMGRKREESGSQLHEDRMKPYHIYFEGNAGLLARDYAKFPNKVLWKLAEKVREVVSARQSGAHRRLVGHKLDRNLRRQTPLRYAVSRRRSSRPLPLSLGAVRCLQWRRRSQR